MSLCKTCKLMDEEGYCLAKIPAHVFITTNRMDIFDYVKRENIDECECYQKESYSSRRKYKLKVKLFNLQKGKCYWCKCDLLLTRQNFTNRKIPQNIATLDHLDSRLSKERGKHPKKLRKVLACKKCNDNRGKAENDELSLDQRWKRSGRFPVERIYEQTTGELK